MVEEEIKHWIAENLIRGCDKAIIRRDMLSAGYNIPDIAIAIAEVESNPYYLACLSGSTLHKNRVEKFSWILRTLSTLEKMDKKENGFEVDVVETIEPKRFFKEYYYANRPLKITGMIKDWPALTKWTPEYITKNWGDIEVSVQSGRDTNSKCDIEIYKHTGNMLLKDFIEKIKDNETNDLYLTARDMKNHVTKLKGMFKDVNNITGFLTDFDFEDTDKGYYPFLWIGPKGTKTVTHHDLTNNLFMQLVGRKKVWLSQMNNQIYIPNDHHVYSSAAIDEPDLVKYPTLKNACISEVTINPGEILFIPVGCWHMVRSLDFSISFTCTNFVVDNDFSSFYNSFGEV